MPQGVRTGFHTCICAVNSNETRYDTTRWTTVELNVFFLASVAFIVTNFVLFLQEMSERAISKRLSERITGVLWKQSPGFL